jgi:hypothetical protein
LTRKPPERCRILAEKIAAILREGLDLSPQTLHYIDSTFSAPSTEEMLKIINDESDSESDSLVELIFFPDEDLQIALEKFLEHVEFKPEDEAIAADCLARLKPHTRIFFPDDRRTLELSMPESSAGQLVARLKISKKLDPRLIEIIGRSVAEIDRDRFKVWLRNSRFTGSESNVSFLCRFFEQWPAQREGFFQALEFILNFLDEVPEDTDLFVALMRKKRFYVRSLQKAEKYEEQMKGKNIETLLLQGLRIPYADKGDAIKKIRIIDGISLAVFGKTDYGGHPVDGMSVDISLDPSDVQNMMRLLS